MLIGILVGALSAGVLGDAVGRRRIMMYALGLYCAATLVAAFAPTWEVFFIARIIAGIGVGAEAAIIPPFISEFVPARYRGLCVGSVAGFFSFGYVAAALLGRLFVPSFDNGWRIAQILTALPVLMLLWWRRRLPESPRWLLGRGRRAEAETIVESLETAVRASGRVVPPVPVPPADPPAASVAPDLPANSARSRLRGLGQGLVQIWRGGLARRTSVLWLLWFATTFAFYGFFIWLPSLLVARGLTITTSLSYALLITVAQIPGYYTAAFLNERLDRRGVIGCFLIGGAVSAFLMANAGSNTALLAYGVMLSFFMNGTYAGLYAYSPEVYPTPVRATGMGCASAVGRIGGISAPILVGVLFASIGFVGVFSMVACVLVLGAVAVLFLGLHTRGRTLEDLGPKTESNPGPTAATLDAPDTTYH